jgi:hypothetical protein
MLCITRPLTASEDAIASVSVLDMVSKVNGGTSYKEAEAS